MNPAAAPPHGLKFHWPQRSPISLPLVGFLFLSLLVHGLAFYILQVVDPPAVVIQPPPAQLNLLTTWKITASGTAASPENIALLQWIDAQDPAPVATAHEVVPATLYDLPYERSLSGISATPKSPGENESAVQFPPAEETMSLIGSSQESTPAPVAVPVPRPTELIFSAGLATRKIARRPPMTFTAGTENRAPDSFMVGVGAAQDGAQFDGKVMYVFFMGMGTDDELVKQAGDYLKTVEFSHAPGGISWGIATYYWGDDSNASAAAKP